MNFEKEEIVLTRNLEIRNLLSENGKDSLTKEILDGLQSETPYISSKFFYDDKGSELFENITRLKEYYPTKTEQKILKANAAAFVNSTNALDIIELGSGDCSKISILLEAMQKRYISDIRYIPVDVSKAAILQSAEELVERFPDLRITGHVLDFTTHIDELPHTSPATFCFFGSTIGNFDRPDARDLLSNISSIMNDDDKLLVGFDMIKDLEVLNAAYNDSEGLTAEFNKNILKVLNGIIGSDFDTSDFLHLAFFNTMESRIEMHLEARKNISIHSEYLSDTINIRQGERIHTENSYKFTMEMIHSLAAEANLKVDIEYSDSENWFSLISFVKA